jgi:outer membrane protein assembly factor BamA
MKGALFYDGGAGFDNPYVNTANSAFIQRNRFDYRHSVGFGIRMLSPMPVKIDWAFKIDPRSYESAYELHFGMTYDW